MTFVWREDYAVDGKGERVEETLHPLVANRNWNCVFVVVALVHNLDFVMLVDPYQCLNIHVLVIAAKSPMGNRIRDNSTVTQR